MPKNRCDFLSSIVFLEMSLNLNLKVSDHQILLDFLRETIFKTIPAAEPSWASLFLSCNQRSLSAQIADR